MNYLIAIRILIILISMNVEVRSQGILTDSSISPVKDPKWLISFSLGAVVIGSRNSVEKGLEQLGLGEDDNRGEYKWDYGTNQFVYVGGHIEYPQVSQLKTWRVAARYNFSRRSAVSVSWGRALHLTAKGYSLHGFSIAPGIEILHEVKLVQEVYTVNADYIWRSKSGFGGIAVGPVLGFQKVTEYFSEKTEARRILPGFHIGYNLPIVDNPHWFLGAEFNYTWLPSTEIGPVTNDLNITTGGSYPGSGSSSTDDVMIPLSNLQFGITTGWRF